MAKASAKAIDFYKIATDDLLVICDDFNLDRGRIRIRRNGSAGGQNGLKDIIRHLSTEMRLLGCASASELHRQTGTSVTTCWEKSKSKNKKASNRQPLVLPTQPSSGPAKESERPMNKFNADPNAKPKPTKQSKEKSDAADAATDEDANNEPSKA